MLEAKIRQRNNVQLVWNEDVFIPKMDDRKTLTLQCFPLYSILKAFGNTRLDFLSLDIEGNEFSVMKSILQEEKKFSFNVATIEKAHMNERANNGSFIEFHYMMRANGFHIFDSLYNDVLYERSL